LNSVSAKKSKKRQHIGLNMLWTQTSSVGLNATYIIKDIQVAPPRHVGNHWSKQTSSRFNCKRLQFVITQTYTSPMITKFGFFCHFALCT